ncbi:hypothetical protein ACTI_85460 [Actinoplanes sp. OR16]|uniref:hypothetical protein n=1 Tax=Actinoplanes sp. OR16 TaxID=946334 RepID=UPI000F6BC699|nr:hypothetical protein [Actinoplanes sp. OR16]BBH71861.1 hypothetical protein ACTI_85460 [Actinoplanes sp. OR16]
MSKADRVLGSLPHFYRAGEPGKLLGRVVRDLAGPVEDADTHLFRIQRAHRIGVAEQPVDVVRLAALLGLTPFHFEDLAGEPTGMRLAMMRDRVQRIARLRLGGLGTPDGILEIAAIFLGARIAGPVRRVDPDGFSRRATVDFPHRPDRPRAEITLHENPLRRQSVPAAERWPGRSWTVGNDAVGAATPLFSIEGVGDRTVLPSIFCPATRTTVHFHGIVPDGRTLLIDAAGGARIGPHAVDDWLVVSTGGLAGFAVCDDDRYTVDDEYAARPFDGDLDELSLPPVRRRHAVPGIPPGRTDWYFKVADGVCDAARFDYAVFGTPPEPVGVFDDEPGFDAGVYAYPASAVAGMAWDGAVPCAFKLLLPAPASAGESGRVAAVLPAFKPAGVRAYVDTERDAWVLGSSVIRAPDAGDGEGVDHSAARPRSPAADRYIS